MLAPAQAVIGARRDQEHGRERWCDERGEEDVAIDGAQLREAVCERNREQEPRTALYAGQRNAQLVEQLDQLAVVTLLCAFWHKGSIPAMHPA
jgi:propanediol dehydratase large subunit